VQTVAAQSQASCVAMLGLAWCLACNSPERIPVQQEDGGVQWVQRAKIVAGPRQHETLTAEQVARITRLQKTFAEVDSSTLAKWLDDFKHDANVDRELSVYESIATAFVTCTSQHLLTADERREAYSLLLVRSGASEEETLAHAKLRYLNRDQARELLREYTAAPQPVRGRPK
jgi:hypothetical protein